MLVKMIDEKTGELVWGDAGDIEQRFTSALDEDAGGKFMIGVATLDDGRRERVRIYYGGPRRIHMREETARRHLLVCFMIENAHIRPRPSAEAIAEHVARDPAHAARNTNTPAHLSG